MFQVLSYPLDVIKTNRIVGTPFAKEAGEAIPKEFLALSEIGGLKGGLFRGFAPFFIALPFWQQVHSQSTMGFPLITLLSGSVMLNPFAVMTTKRQLVRGNEGAAPASYRALVGEMGGMGMGLLRLYTLGAPAHICRNVALTTCFIPAQMGS